MLPTARQLAPGFAATLLSLSVVACGSADPAAARHHPRKPLTVSTAEIFGPANVFNQALEADAPVDASSPSLVARLAEEVAEERDQHVGPWIETTSYTTPVYTVPRRQRLVRVTLENNRPWARTLRKALKRVPLPASAQPAAGTDAQITVWQPSTDRLWELWRARKEDGAWHAAWGGVIDNVHDFPGYYTPSASTGTRTYWGATASSLPVAEGLVTVREAERGAIDHALALDLPTTRLDAYVAPAQRTDGEDPSPNSIPEGARLRINPGVDIASLNLPPLAAAMALAAQRYGMIVRDQTHHAIGFYAEDPTPTGANPWPKLMGYESPAELLADFPWQDVEVLQMNLTNGTGRPTA